MGATFWQSAGLALLLAGIVLGEALLQRYHPLGGAARRARLVALVATLGGAIGAPAWWQNMPYAFSWTLPPVAARFLAVAAVSFVVVGLRVLVQPGLGHLRLMAVMLAVYLGPLTAAILLLHLDRFDFAAPVVWAFFAIVVLLLTGAVAALVQLPAAPAQPLRLPSLVLGTATGLWGLVLFLWPAGPLPLLWPWAGDPLTSRLIASMFLTVAAASLTARRDPERRSALWLALLYGGGIAVTSAMALAAGKPASPAYLLFWAIAAALAATTLLAAARRDNS